MRESEGSHEIQDSWIISHETQRRIQIEVTGLKLFAFVVPWKNG